MGEEEASTRHSPLLVPRADIRPPLPAFRRLSTRRPTRQLGAHQPNRFSSPVSRPVPSSTTPSSSSTFHSTMSLLRSCQQAVRRQTAARAAFIASRTYATDSNIPQAAEQKQDTEVAQPPSQDVMTADIVSGAPSTFISLCVAFADPLQTTATEELRHRTVRIFQPTRSTTQSGTGKSERWRIDWDILPGGGRWENPLMGWASSYVFHPSGRLVRSTTMQCGLHARHALVIPHQGGRHPFC